MKLRTLAPIAALAAAACVAPPAPKAPPPRPPAPAPVTPPPSVAANWIDRPLTPGAWTHARDARGSIAQYGVSGAPAALIVRCDASASRITLARVGTAAGPMTLRATTGARTYNAAPAAAQYVAAEIAPSDLQLDALAFSRGRFLVGLAGAADVIVPTWPEFTRVIEDCRR